MLSHIAHFEKETNVAQDTNLMEYCFHCFRALPYKLILRGKTHLSFHIVCCAPWCQSFPFSRDARNLCHHLRVESGVQEDDGADAFSLLALSNSCRQNSWTETNQIKQSGAYGDGFRTVDHRGTFPKPAKNENVVSLQRRRFVNLMLLKSASTPQHLNVFAEFRGWKDKFLYR